LKAAGFEPLRDRVSDHKSHPRAYGEYRGLLRKVPSVTPAVPGRSLERTRVTGGR
jgi:hypothetical protein